LADVADSGTTELNGCDNSLQVSRNDITGCDRYICPRSNRNLPHLLWRAGASLIPSPTINFLSLARSAYSSRFRGSNFCKTRQSQLQWRSLRQFGDYPQHDHFNPNFRSALLAAIEEGLSVSAMPINLYFPPSNRQQYAADQAARCGLLVSIPTHSSNVVCQFVRGGLRRFLNTTACNLQSFAHLPHSTCCAKAY